MARKYLFTDEAGNFDFSGGPGASRYFLLTTMTLTDCKVGHQLLDLRRELAIEGVPDVGEVFHATEDKQHVRNRVFSVIEQAEFELHTTVFEKARSDAKARGDEYFYKVACFLHFKRILARIDPGDELLVVAASLGTKGKRKAFDSAFCEVVQRCAPGPHSATCWSAASNPCLQAADYCSWAMQRKWERSDTRSYQLIAPRIASEVDQLRGTQMPEKRQAGYPE